MCISAHIFYISLGRRAQEREKRNGMHVKGRGFPSYSIQQVYQKMKVCNSGDGCCDL